MPLITLIGDFQDSVIAPLPTPTNNTAVVNLGVVPEQVTIAGTTYIQSPNPTPQPGEYLVLPSGEIQIALSPGVEAGDLVVASGAESIRTDYLAPPYPAIFYQLPIQGSFSWTDNFEGHPSGSLNFTTWAGMRDRVVSLLCEGAEFSAFGIGFRVSSLSFTESSNGIHEISVQVGLGGRHENYDFDVPLKGGGTVSTQSPALELDPNCAGQIPDGAQKKATPTYTSVQALAAKVGDAFSGPFMKVPIAAEGNESGNFMNLAQQQVRMFGCFLDYSNFGSVSARSFYGVAHHHLDTWQIKSDISTSVAGRKRRNLGVGNAFQHPDLVERETIDSFQPSTFNLQPSHENTSIYPWVATYDPKRKLEGKFSEPPEAVDKEDTTANSEYQQPRWKAHVPVRKVVPKPVDDPSIPPAGTGALKDISLTFDNSGPTKEQEIEITEDDQPVESSYKKYGFVFYGKNMFTDGGRLVGATQTDAIDDRGGVAPGCWQPVEQWTKKHFWDMDGAFSVSRDTGYYLGWDLVGEILGRYKVESTSLETTKLDPKDSIEGAVLNCHYFQWIPNLGAERYYLEAKRDYYNDMPPRPVETYKICLPNGTSQYAQVEDPSWVEEFFVVRKTTRENAFSARPDPENSPPDELRQPLTRGQERYHEEWVTVLPSVNTRTDNFNIPNPSLQVSQPLLDEQDSYIVTQRDYSSGDAQFANSLAMSTGEKNYGRPPTHLRRTLWDKVEPEADNGSSNKSSPTAQNQIEHYLSSGGINPDARVEGGSLSYPFATTLSQALTAAQTDLTIQNLTGGTKDSFSIDFNLNMKAGDTLTYVACNTVRPRRILSISREVLIDSKGGAPILLGRNCNINLGIERAAPMVYSSRKAPVAAPERKPKGQTLQRLYIPDRYPLGEILDPNLPSRRNFNL
ncbi:hypothetical protein [Allocoleopsis sp.]|uniref:hypothetical protein n=1 Tax=Allocoleopsis sp. TaxID=3088169 RepID=UPI002FD2D6C4